MRQTKQVLMVVLVVLAAVSVITLGLTYNQANDEKKRLEEDIRYRSTLLASSLKDPVESNFVNKSDEYLQRVVERFVDDQRIAGLAIVDNMEAIVAASSNLPKDISVTQEIAADAMDEDKANGGFARFNDRKMYVFAEPLRDEQAVVGSLVVIQNASYIDGYVWDVWKRNVLRLSLQALLFAAAIFLILRWVVHRPLQRLLTALKLTKIGKSGKNPEDLTSNPLFDPLLQEFSSIQKRLTRARTAAQEATRNSLQKLDSPWTAERLRQFTVDLLKDRTIVAVSNREPYIHTKEGNKIKYYVPASGVVTALEPIMDACGGLWVAHGAGDADKLVTDKDGKIKVPPDEPSYTLKRVWLSDEENKGYYEGYANGGVWPLCHLVHTRPNFKKEDWEQYEKVNQKFADAVLEEIKGQKKPIVIIQDYHFALLPRMIKKVRPDAAVCIFWHIPWPTAEAFSICPWKKEMLDGLLGADVVGFHTQLFCNNFINTVSKELEALVDLEQFSITKNTHTSYVKPFPISIDYTGIEPGEKQLESQEQEVMRLREQLGIKSEYLAVGVERLDYTKGLIERFKALELFFENNPSYVGKLSVVQIAAPSRTSVKEYQDFESAVVEEVERINNRFKRNNWKPITLIKEHRDHDFIKVLYRAADVCLVTPLHDGMNLVAKEFVASRNDNKGALILSQYAGASQELRDALIINPYDAHQAAQAIKTALEMKPAEQTARMKKMRAAVKNHNVYQWSAEILKQMAELE